MAEKTVHIKMFDNIFRVIEPGYATVSCFENKTLNGLGKAMIDVVVGDDYAAVIDTGYGTIDLKGYIEENITDKPLICINTHGHVDHIGANAQFGKVLLGWRDIPCAEKMINIPIPRCDAVKNCPKPTYEPLYGGEIIDLGGRTLRAIPIPGHSFGSMGFIDSKTKVLFSGDAVLKRVIAALPNAKFLRTTFVNLKKEDFSDILCGHWIWPLGRDQIDRFISLIDSASPEKFEVLKNSFGDGSGKDSYMIRMGKDFYDPDFCALTIFDFDTFFADEFELGDKVTP